MSSTLSPAATAVFKALRSVPKRGLTDDEIVTRTGLSYETASRRRRELISAGLVQRAGSRRELTTGYTGNVWVIA